MESETMNINQETEKNLAEEMKSIQGSQIAAEKPPTRETMKMKEEFGFFGLASLLYAGFYTFCMYRNIAGITYPFFVAGSLFFFYLCMQKLGISVKRGSAFYAAGMLLLGIATFLTADVRMIFLNKAGVFLLALGFLLHQFYEDKNWGFGKSLSAMICTVFGSMGRIGRPFQDFAHWRGKNGRKTGGKGVYIAVGICIALPLMLVIWFLLMTADRIFMNMTEAIFDGMNLSVNLGILFRIGFVFFAAYCTWAYLGERRISDKPGERKQTEPIMALTVALPLTVLYMAFCGIQIVYLFMGKVNLQGITYAEYAREGFFQLLFVCTINWILVLIGGHYFKESLFLKIVLTIMSLCTYIMIFSAGMRMILYIQRYYLTFLRILVLWALFVLFLLLTGVLISIYRPGFTLFHYSLVTVTVCYIVLAFLKPDYLVARCNLGNAGDGEVHAFFDTDAYHDYWYLRNLSADAAPVIIPFLEEEGYRMSEAGNSGSEELYTNGPGSVEGWGYYYMRDIKNSSKDLNIRTFNFSKYIAGKMLEGYRAGNK